MHGHCRAAAIFTLVPQALILLSQYMVLCANMVQVLAKIASEADPDADGLTFQDFQSILQHAPDFVSNFRINP